MPEAAVPIRLIRSQPSFHLKYQFDTSKREIASPDAS